MYARRPEGGVRKRQSSVLLLVLLLFFSFFNDEKSYLQLSTTWGDEKPNDK